MSYATAEARAAYQKAYRLKNAEKIKSWKREYQVEFRKKLSAQKYPIVLARIKKHKAVINELKSKPCMDCGNCFPPECMDFDHRDPATKSFTIASKYTRSLPKMLAEIEKCDLVCANCHRTRTLKQQRAQRVLYEQSLKKYQN